LHRSGWALDSANAVPLAVRADLAHLGEGIHTVDVMGPSPALPQGVALDDLVPRRITVRLARTSGISAQSKE
jgi:hypothetical protein